MPPGAALAHDALRRAVQLCESASYRHMKLPVLLIATLLATPQLRADPIKFESGDTQATLVELFTSEGCSSCPPADAWMSKLKSNSDLWTRIVPVVFHVDYWNSLGWPDRFATEANTPRQRRYALAWRIDSVYTPGFVLNGQEWRDWFQRGALPEPSSAKVGKIAVTLDDRKADVIFVPSVGGLKALQVEMAFLGGNLESNVTRGENTGRRIRHDFTVLQYLSAPLRPAGGRFTATVPLPPRTGDAPVALAAWVTTGDAQPPIQATGGWLTRK